MWYRGDKTCSKTTQRFYKYLKEIAYITTSIYYIWIIEEYRKKEKAYIHTKKIK